MSIEMPTRDLNILLRQSGQHALLNDVTPAAPDGNTNVTFQTDVFNNISAYVPTSGGGSGTMAAQDADAVAITGGTVDGVLIGSVTPAAGSFTTLTASPGLRTADQGSGYTQLSLGNASILGGTNDANLYLFATNVGSVDFVFGAIGTTPVFSVAATGLLTINPAPTATTATAGAATTLPLTPAGYLEVSLNGANVKIPYYAT